MIHCLAGKANDWAQCSCGKLFATNNFGKAIDKLNKHVDEKNENLQKMRTA